MEETFSTIDPEEEIIEDYIKSSNALRRAGGKEICPLESWKLNEIKYPQPASIARKFLSVKASSAACERMFSKAGLILTANRRSMSSLMFCDLVHLKLNEQFF